MSKYINMCIGYNRYIYNKCIYYYKKFYECNKKIVDTYNKDIIDESKKIKYYYLTETEIKNIINNNKESWESKYPMAIMDMAFKRFWIALKQCFIYKLSNFPKFHKKNHSSQSFTYDNTKSKTSKLIHDNNKKFKFNHGINSPIKKQYRWIKLTEKLRFQGKVKQVHIIREYGRCYATFVVELDNDIPKLAKTNNIIGIDLGIKMYYHDSNNKKIRHKNKTFNMQKHINKLNTIIK